MKKTILVSMALLSIAALTSCTVTSYQSRVNYVTRREVMATPVVVDVKVDFTKKVTGEGVASMPEPAKEAALFAAMEASGADVVVDPVFTISKSTGTFRVKVSGYHGKYENARSFLEAAKQNNGDGSFDRLLRFWGINPTGSEESKKTDKGGKLF